jgi:hypothetical protein
MQSLYLLSQAFLTTATSPHSNNMSSTTADILIWSEFTASAITFIKNPSKSSPHTPPAETTTTPTEQPTYRPALTIAPDSEPKEGKIISHVHHHGYPLSPQSSLNVLQGHADLEAGTLHTIAIGLANTAIGHMFQHLEAWSEIKQLRKELTNLRAQMSREPDAKWLPDFTIPDANGIMQQARHIKLGNGPVPFALGTLGQDSDPVFQYDLFAAPLYIRDTPTEPLPMWLIDAISGKSSFYHQAIDLAHSTDNWGLVAELACYHESDMRVLNITAEIHVLDCELQVIKVASHQSHSRLKGARAQHRLHAL